MKTLVTAILLALLGVTVACGGGGQPSSASPVLAQIQLTAQNPDIVVGQTEQLSATGKFTDSSSRDMTSLVSWSSSSTSTATISANGTLTAVGSGQTTITASMQGVSGTISITVAPALVSLAVTPANSKIARQTTIQFTATGTYTDNSEKDLTSSV